MKGLGVVWSMVAAVTMATAADYEFTPVVGYVIKEGNLNLENELLVGGELQFNDTEGNFKPELSLLYSPKTEYDDNDNDTDITRFALNGVHEYGLTGGIVPFVKLGVGFEYMSTRLYENQSDLFVDVGGGVKLPLNDTISLKLEALYMLKDPADDQDSNLAMLVGLSIPFGGETASKPMVVEKPVEHVKPKPKPAPAPKPVPVRDSDGDGVNDTADACPKTASGVRVDAKGCPLDSDKDGVTDALDRCANTPKGIAVDAYGCALDTDKDGVIDPHDQCPDTPQGFKVDAEGCPLSMDLALTYETNSAKIDAASTPKVHAFALFLNENSGYNVHVIGHTDNRGAAIYNKKLSEKRAASVRDMLVEQGVATERVTIEGRGESDPKADNGTVEGRKANRRIEVQLRR